MQRVRIAGAQPTPANRWFEKRRDFHVRCLYSSFAGTYERFVELYQGYVDTGRIDFDELARLVGSDSNKGPLWQLKDHCHRLYKESDEQNGRLLDWLIGSIFHEAMKLKENIYMAQVYGPTDQPEQTMTADHSTLHCGVSRQNFMRGIVREARRQVDNLTFLFNRANFLLRMLLLSQASNVLLLRLLLEDDTISTGLWGESVDQLFGELFPDQAEQGYLLAAKGYFDGQWLKEALAAYSKALALNPELEEARRRSYLIRTMINDRHRIMAA